MRVLALFLLGLVTSLAALAQDEAPWKDRYGNPVPDTESRRSVGGLAGWLVVTPDRDWREKWETPSVLGPSFREAKKVAKGQQAHVLVFFANPKLNGEGRADLACDFDIAKPDGTSAFRRADAVCFKGTIESGAHKMYLAGPVVDVVTEAGDPVGTWTVKVSLRDKVRNTVLPLKTTFTLE
ncbi:hypothetical protein QTI66_17075 [Variovorax sp. J22R133]|uniref:hypothetical protein n=1 Tax=Variovorax brevis TaxID=3053503 RepID=UPI002575BCAD|nr:hypothetical protein [Variovorax sp. J22R133]MDM0113874.1 hypothetical protein [Variovorax sp. J22R133]